MTELIKKLRRCGIDDAADEIERLTRRWADAESARLKADADLAVLQGRLAAEERMHKIAQDQSETIANQYAEALAERALIVARAENAEAALVEAEADVKAADDLRRRWENRAYAADALLRWIRDESTLDELSAAIDAHLSRKEQP